MLKKTLLSAIIVVGVFSPVFVFAQASSVTTQCWVKQDCIDIRKDLVADAAEAEAGFYGTKDAEGKENAERSAEITRVCGATTDATGRELGFCLPSSLTVTKITFGGRSKFAHMGEFIQYMYRYGVGVAGILGTVMIIFGGFQWATSGGNSATIGLAKKKITGSIIGMLIAVASYTILNTINPALVNLRVPGVFMINSMGLPPTYCDQITSGKKVSLTPSGDFKLDPKTDTVCGQKYYVDGTGNQQCEGRGCEKGVCFPVSLADEGGGKKLVKQPVCDQNYDILIRYRITGAMTTLFGFASQWFGNLTDIEIQNSGKVGWMYTQDHKPTNHAFVEWRDFCCAAESQGGGCKYAKLDWSIEQRVKMYYAPKTEALPFRDVYAYYDYDKLSKSDTSKCPDGYKDTIPGGMFIHYLDKADTSNFYGLLVAPDAQNKLILGTINTILNNPNWSYFRYGTDQGYFEANITDEILNKVLNQK